MFNALTWSPDSVWLLLQKAWWFLVVLGVLVAVTRFAFPDRTVAVVEGDRPALVESATTVVEERELVAA